MLGSCYHGGLAKKSVDEERLVFATFSTKGFLRQVSKMVHDQKEILITSCTGGESIPCIVEGRNPVF